MRYGLAIPDCLLVLGMLAVAAPIASQSRGSFEIGEAELNAGGDPFQGVLLTSASFTISLDSLGDTLDRLPLSGLSYRLEGGLVTTFRPLGETRNLHFASNVDLLWDSDPAAFGYRMYRGRVGSACPALQATASPRPRRETVSAIRLCLPPTWPGPTSSPLAIV